MNNIVLILLQSFIITTRNEDKHPAIFAMHFYVELQILLLTLNSSESKTTSLCSRSTAISRRRLYPIYQSMVIIFIPASTWKKSRCIGGQEVLVGRPLHCPSNPLGVLRWPTEPACLQSPTGSSPIAFTTACTCRLPLSTRPSYPIILSSLHL